MLKDLLIKALASEIGIAVISSDTFTLRSKLYAIKAELRAEGDLRYENLSFTLSPLSRKTLWIFKAQKMYELREELGLDPLSGDHMRAEIVNALTETIIEEEDGPDEEV